MNAVFKADKSFGGSIDAISSKSELHRMVIAAALSGERTEISCRSDSLDVDATLACAEALGVGSESFDGGILLHGRTSGVERDRCIFRCGESGSTLRFMLPVASALGCRSTFVMAPSLARRPHDELCRLLASHGVEVRFDGERIYTEGKLQGGEYVLPGNISSQYVTGLLLALPIAECDSRVVISGKLMSQPYVDMTLEIIRRFGIEIERDENGYLVRGGQRYSSPGSLCADGDWSNAAALLCMGALSEKGVACRGINCDSAQGDRAILRYLSDFGASVTAVEGGVRVASSGILRAIEVDITDTPDVALLVGVMAACAEGETVILGTDRLRYKESDRRLSLCNTVNSLGATAEIEDNRIIVRGVGRLHGATIPSFNDHRVVMAAAVASVFSGCDTAVEDAEAISKSYKSFFGDFAALGGSVTTLTI